MPHNWTAAQLRAIDERGRTLLVSAAAVSGKTAVLTERIIRSLLDKEHPADISRTNALSRAASAVDLRLLDHIILSDDSYYSFSDEKLYSVLH